jgi:hypothetical protein
MAVVAALVPFRAAGPTDFTVSGTVRDTAGRPLAGALVRWVPFARSKELPHCFDRAVLVDGAGAESIASDWTCEHFATGVLATTGAAGRYEIRQPPVGGQDVRYGLLIAGGEGREIQVRDVGLQQANGSASVPAAAVDFALGPGSSISGRVSDRRNDAPAEGMVAIASSARWDAPTPGRLVRGACALTLVLPDGSYRFDGLPPGEHWISLLTGESDFIPPPPSKARKVVLAAGEEANDADI